MTQISAVIITFNEEKNIERCIKSLMPIADEIVVIDSYSTDKTKKICEKYSSNINLKFIEHQFDGHIEQKNWAITQAKYKHILSLDADEALDDELQKEILKIKENFGADGYFFNRLTNYCGKWVYHCGWYPDRKLRLWNSTKGQWGGDNPHDKFEMFDKKAILKHLKGNILHYSYYTKEDHYKQVEYFTTILAKSQEKKGKKSSLLILIFSPIIKFIKDYFFNLGILDGKTGFTICRISAYATYLKYKKIRKLKKSN